MMEQENKVTQETEQEKKRQQSLRLMEAMNDVDDDLLLRAQKEPKVLRFPVMAGKMVAAVLVLFMAGAVFYSATGNNKKQSTLGFRANSIMDNFALINHRSGDASPQLDESVKSDVEMAESNTKNNSVGETNKETAQQNVTEGMNSQAYVLSMGLDEAKEVEQLGEYIPTNMPEGFAFTEAILSMDEVNTSLQVFWRTQEEEECSILIRKASMDEIYVMDVNDTDRYDVRKYQIPYADTVPEEYLTEFISPVFSAGDMTEEIVNSRMQEMTDFEDEVPVANFGILLEDGILVNFHAKMGAQELWSVVSELL